MSANRSRITILGWIHRAMRPKWWLMVLREWWMRMLLRHPKLCGLYCLFSSEFNREIHAVISARHARLADEARGSLFDFRRMIHRLEKGLVTPAFRPDFASGYIEKSVAELVALEQKLDACSLKNRGDMRLEEWAYDVMTAYFERAGQHPAIEKARKSFQALERTGKRPAGSCHPSPLRILDVPFSLGDFSNLVKSRRSVRHFQDRAVDREAIDRAVDLARFAPSACNRQPFEYRIYDDPELVRAVGAIPGGARTFYEDCRCFAVVIGRLEAFERSHDRHVIYIDASLSVMLFVLSLEIQGIASCCINWIDQAQQESQIRELLQLEPTEQVVLYVGLGYPHPDAQAPYSAKREIEEMRRFNYIPSGQ